MGNCLVTTLTTNTNNQPTKSINMKYNGHKNHNHWNVSLWINNHQGLYDWAQQLLRTHTKQQASEIMADTLEGQATPDGVQYSFSSIRAALVGM